jgi:hypothetical protein
MRKPWNVNKKDILYIVTEELRGYGVTVTDLTALKERLSDIEDCYRAEVAKK